MPKITSEMVMDWYDDYVQKYKGDLKKGTGRDWTPFRFCSEDWLLAVCVVRATRMKYEVGLFGSGNHCDFEPDAGLKAALSFMLADAFHRTGKMELRFSGPRHGQEPSRESGYCCSIPTSLRRFAESVGVTLPSGRVISADKGEALYRQMVGLDEKLAARLMALDVDPTRSGFLLHRGTLSAETLEIVARYSESAKAVLEGRLVPENWLSFKRELLLLRRGILAERVRVLFELGVEEERERIQVEWINSSTVELTAACGIKLTIVTEEFIQVPAGEKATVILCPLDEVELARLDFSALREESIGSRFIAVPRNFKWMSSELKELWLTKAKEHGFAIMSIYESLDELDSEVLVRLERLATTRMMIEEQKE